MDTKTLEKILKLNKAGLSLREIGKLTGKSYESVRIAIIRWSEKYENNLKVGRSKK